LTGSLHEVTPIELASHALRALRDRSDLDTGLIDDEVLGCVEPAGEQGADIARVAVLNADWAETVSGVQINRFCASGLEACNMAAAAVMSGQSKLSVGGGVESMSRVPMGTSGGAWMADPQVAFKTYFVPQGISADLIATKYGYSRTDVDSYAMESQKRAAQAWSEGRFTKSTATSTCGPTRPCRASPRSSRPSPRPARISPSMTPSSNAIRTSSASPTCTTAATRRASSKARPRC
jgi:acetyl-CoA C-acetyltransferase